MSLRSNIRHIRQLAHDAHEVLFRREPGVDGGSGADGDSLLGRHRDGGFGGSRRDERLLRLGEGVQVERPADGAAGHALLLDDREAATVERVRLELADRRVTWAAPGCPALAVVVDVHLHVEVPVGVGAVDHEQAETGVGVDQGLVEVDHLALCALGRLEDEHLPLRVLLGADTTGIVVDEGRRQLDELRGGVGPGVRAEHVLLAGDAVLQDDDVLAGGGVEEVCVHQSLEHVWYYLPGCAKGGTELRSRRGFLC